MSITFGRGERVVWWRYVWDGTGGMVMAGGCGAGGAVDDASAPMII